jgi:ABC-type nitrate/sulfonate/bicarbonate transport system substrate-binding protein
MLRVRLLSLLATALLLLTACQPAAPAAPTAAPAKPAAAPTQAPAASKSMVPFKWLFGFRIQANPSTAAIVIAKELGYYAEQGLDLTWDTSNDSTSLRLVASNQYQAGSVSSSGTLIDMVNEKLPVKSISVINHDNSKTFAIRKGSGISRPKDFEGKTVGYKVSPWVEYLAMLSYDNVDRSKIKEIEVGFSSVEMKEGKVDVLPVFKSNEPYTLKNVLQVEVDYMDPRQWGYPSFGTALIVNTDYAKSNPEQVAGFLKATLRGLQYYLDNKQKSLEIIAKYSPKEVTPELQNFLYEVESPQVTMNAAKSAGLGAQTKDMWQKEIDLLFDLKVTKGKPAVDELIDNSFLDKAVKDTKLVWP